MTGSSRENPDHRGMRGASSRCQAHALRRRTKRTGQGQFCAVAWGNGARNGTWRVRSDARLDRSQMHPSLTPRAVVFCQFTVGPDGGSICASPLAYSGRGRPPKYCPEHRREVRRSANARHQRSSRWFRTRVLVVASLLPQRALQALQDRALFAPCPHSTLGPISAGSPVAVGSRRLGDVDDAHVRAAAEFARLFCHRCFGHFLRQLRTSGVRCRNSSLSRCRLGGEYIEKGGKFAGREKVSAPRVQQ